MIAELFLNGAVESLRDQFYEDRKMDEASLLETVGEGRTKLHDETNECTREISSLVQDRLGQPEPQSDRSKTSVEEQLACLGYRSNRFAKLNGDKQYATKITERCRSA